MMCQLWQCDQANLITVYLDRLQSELSISEIISTVLTTLPGMKTALLLLHFMVASPLLAWPGVSQILSARQDGIFGDDSLELLGDLRPERGGPKSPVGWVIWGILTGSTEPQGFTEWQGGLSSPSSQKCITDTCCIWRHIALDMEKLFRGQSGRCTKYARAAIRLGFHDAGTWSKFDEDYGGADGSIILANELGRPENNGLQEIGAVTLSWYRQYRSFGIGMADLIQMGANVATVVCPLGPRVRTFVGRQDSLRPAPDNLLRSVFADADSLIQLFENKTIRAHGLTALVGAHTTSQQHFVDPSRAGDPQDMTPGIWDVGFYSQTTGSAPPRVFRFPSDVKLSLHPRIASEWSQFAAGQKHWNEDYAREYVRLSLLGVSNINGLVECTHVLPAQTLKTIISDDRVVLNKWLNGSGRMKKPEKAELQVRSPAASLQTGPGLQTDQGHETPRERPDRGCPRPKPLYHGDNPSPE
ncbi:hypothetical protein VTL71DRAFT_13270 [Oculimacula yallundae]|uniref:Peroxidase n=1 Tax=Oculimacula yallundae TaxID=86028 RepID=A0ABR4CKF6_9HELO